MSQIISKNQSTQRPVVYGKKGMVATSQPLAAVAGLDMLKRGGNAVDAAIATAAMLTVVEPTSNGIGGDAFAIVWMKDQLYGLNSSGPAPKLLSSQALRDQSMTEMPVYGFTPVTVPGTPAAWVALSERFGNLPFEVLLEPAIRAAREGYPVSPTVAKYWQVAFRKYKEVLKGPLFESWFSVFAPDGQAPKEGEIWRSECHATTLEAIAHTKGESFYRGELADQIHDFSVKQGGYIRKSDLESFVPEWVEPIFTNYKGYQVYELPPNGHGISTLMALNILKNLPNAQSDTVAYCHYLMEAMKLAYVDTKAYVGEPRFMSVGVSDLLSDNYGLERAKCIGEQAIEPMVGEPQKGGTVYLCTADQEGNMVSYIQSNYMGFGSGIVVPGTGIALHNRGNNFNLIKGHANCIEGGKRPYHTIIPGFLMKSGVPVGPFGVMGGFMQPQGHLQVITNTIDLGLDPQEALDAPRWQWLEGKKISVEADFPKVVLEALRKKGHEIIVDEESGNFGRGQIIWRTENGCYRGGTEKRCDGYIAMY